MISTDNIQVEGLGEEYDISFRDPNIYVLINALQSNLDLLDEARITGAVDVSGLGEGTYQVTVTLDLDENDYVCQPITAEVTISAKGGEEETNPPDGADGPDGTDTPDGTNPPGGTDDPDGTNPPDGADDPDGTDDPDISDTSDEPEDGGRMPEDGTDVNEHGSEEP